MEAVDPTRGLDAVAEAIRDADEALASGRILGSGLRTPDTDSPRPGTETPEGGRKPRSDPRNPA